MSQDRLTLFISGFASKVFNLYLFTHIISCLWIYWMGQSFGDAVSSNLYITCVYFIYQTATVVGYGDVNFHIQNNMNAVWLFTMFVIYFGILSVGYTFNFINSSLSELEAIKEATGPGTDQFDTWLASRFRANPSSVNTDFVLPMKSFMKFLNQFDSRRALEYKDMLNKLPSKDISVIKAKSAENLMIGFDSLFSYLKPNLVEQLLLGSKPVA